jgi:hypothetical protein
VLLQYPSLAMDGAKAAVVENESQVQEAKWMVTVQRWFRRQIRGNHQKRSSTSGIKLFNDTSWICKGSSPGNRPVSKAMLNEVRAALVRSQSKKIKNISCPPSTHGTIDSEEDSAHTFEI